MDPNEALDQARAACLASRRFGTDPTLALDSLAEAFTALDGWLTNGGFLPTDWAQSVPPEREEEDPRYWVLIAEGADGHVEVFGTGTVGIVDEEQGGVIAYAHEANSGRILRALRALDGRLPDWRP